MSVILDNPAGAWALLGLPALIGIHWLQARSKRTRTSTLFLLDRLAPESRGGLRRDKLRRSLPLVLRLLAMLALTWVLCEPRQVKPDATISVSVVLDSSLSMEAFRAKILERLPARLEELRHGAVRVEYTVTESDRRRPVVYHGDSSQGLRDALRAWHPESGAHDASAAVMEACARARMGGVAVYVTDTPDPHTAGSAAILSYGEPVENFGFAGVTIESPSGPWRALVRHYGRESRRISWRIESEGKSGTPSVMELAPGEVGVISGDFPEGVDRFRVVLDGDSFVADDVLPVIRPSPKRIRYFNAIEGEEGSQLARMLSGMPEAVAAPDAASADIVYAREGAASVASKPAVIFPEVSASKPVKGPVLADRHALVAEVSWQGLRVPASAGRCGGASDTPLVWSDGVPIVALRNRPGVPDALVFDFGLKDTNAAKIPAFLVLLHRHLESVREKLTVPYSINTDTNRALGLAAPLGGLSFKLGEGPPRSLAASEAAVLRAPAHAGFFEVNSSSGLRVKGAAAFADTRESDFSRCAEADTLRARERSLVRQVSVPDPWRPVWIVAALALLFGAWWCQRENGSR